MGNGGDRKSANGASIGRASRAQSQVIAVTLLLGLVLGGVTILVTVGTPALEDSKRSAELRAAETDMIELDAKAERVAHRPSSTERLRIDRDDGRLEIDDEGRITVRFVNVSSGDARVVTNETLGTITYENDEGRVASQGGAVFRKTGSGTTMLSTPATTYRNGTLSLDVLTVDGSASLNQQLRVEASDGPERRYPDPNDPAARNPIDDEGVMTLRIKSEYYTAWADYFRTSTPGVVAVDHSARAVTVRFTTGTQRLAIRSGLTGTAPNGELRLAGTGAYTDSYDSSEGAYSDDNATENGTVRAAGDVYSGGDATVEGDVHSGGAVELSGSTEIEGTVHWTDRFEPNGADHDGDEEIDGIETDLTIDPTVTVQVARLADENDNAEASAIDGTSLSTGGSTTTIGAGRYYVDSIDLNNEELVLDTSDGDVVVGVRDYVRLAGSQGSNLTVRGNNSVRFYVASESDVAVSPTGLGDRQVNVHVGKKSHVTVPGDRSEQFWIYGTDEFNATVAGGNSKTTRASFAGVIYAPTLNGSGYTYLKQADVYGAVVSGNTTLGNKGAVHYDEALEESSYSTVADGVPHLEYVHVVLRSASITD